MISKLLYYIIFGFSWILTLLPLRVLYIFSDFAFLILYHLVSYRKNITLTNLENSFPEKSSREIQEISRRFYRQLCDQIIESFKLLHLSKKQILKRFNYTNPEVLNELYDSNKSVIAIIGHHATWEWSVSLPLVLKHKVLAVYQPPSFSDFSKIYHFISRRFGIIPVPRQEVYRVILDCRSRSELTTTFILGDQSPQRDNIKFWTDFLNQDTPAITGFERIAKKTNQAVVYMSIHSKKRGYYDVSFQILSENPKEVKDYELTREYFRLLEETIINQPEFWLWTHRRWKHKRQNH